MVHHSLDYTRTWHLEILCVLIEVGFDPWHPRYMYATLNNDIIQNLYELGWCLAVLFGTQHTWYGRSSISNIFATCAFWAILCLFYCSPPHHTTNMATVPSIVGVFWPYTYMEGIWVFKPWFNPFFWCCGSLFLNGTFGHGNMTCWPKCNVCVLEARIRNVWGIMTLGSSPIGIGWMTGWYLGAPYWF